MFEVLTCFGIFLYFFFGWICKDLTKALTITLPQDAFTFVFIFWPVVLLLVTLVIFGVLIIMYVRRFIENTYRLFIRAFT